MADEGLRRQARAAAASALTAAVQGKPAAAAAAATQGATEQLAALIASVGIAVPLLCLSQQQLALPLQHHSICRCCCAMTHLSVCSPSNEAEHGELGCNLKLMLRLSLIAVVPLNSLQGMFSGLYAPALTALAALAAAGQADGVAAEVLLGPNFIGQEQMGERPGIQHLETSLEMTCMSMPSFETTLGNDLHEHAVLMPRHACSNWLEAVEASLSKSSGGVKPRHRAQTRCSTAPVAHALMF